MTETTTTMGQLVQLMDAELVQARARHAEAVAKCDQLEAAIASIRKIYGLDEAPVVAPPADRPKPKAQSQKPKAASPAPAPASTLSEATARLQAGDKLVAALRVKSPQAPGDLMEAAAVRFPSEASYRNLLVSLAKAGRIVRTGTGRGARVSLPGKPASRAGDKEGL